MLLNKTIKRIEETTWQLIEEAGMKSVPINVEYLSEKYLQIEIKPYNFGGSVAGMLIIQGDNAIIGFDKKNNQSKARKRFTIAHELGHYVLKHSRGGMFIDDYNRQFSLHYRDSNSSTGEIKQEREANAFAAALLMPEPLLKEAFDNLEQQFFNFSNEENDIIGELARKFEVSRMAMIYRIDNLGLFTRGY